MSGPRSVAKAGRSCQSTASSAEDRYERGPAHAKPSLAYDLSSQHRLHAAIAAARAGTDLKPDTGGRPIDNADHARWRAQALDWLRAERDACAKIVESEIVSQSNANRPPNGDARLLPPTCKTIDTLTHHRDLDVHFVI